MTGSADLERSWESVGSSPGSRKRRPPDASSSKTRRSLVQFEDDEIGEALQKSGEEWNRRQRERFAVDANPIPPSPTYRVDLSTGKPSGPPVDPPVRHYKLPICESAGECFDLSQRFVVPDNLTRKIAELPRVPQLSPNAGLSCLS